MAMGGNPKDVYGERNQRPMTRMGIAQVIMDTFDQARDYGKKKVAAGGDPEKMPPFDRAMENVLRVLNREIPVKVHCEQFDMLTVNSPSTTHGARATFTMRFVRAKTL